MLGGIHNWIGYVCLNDGEDEQVICQRLSDFARSKEGRIFALYADRPDKMGDCDRPGLFAAIADIRAKNATKLLVPDLLSLGCDASALKSIFMQLAQCGACLYAIREDVWLNGSNWQVIQTILEHTEKAKKLKRARSVKKALDQIKRSGRKLGSPSFGEQRDEAKVVAQIFKMREHEMSYRSICQALKSAGINSLHGKNWYPTTVKRILERQEAIKRGA